MSFAATVTEPPPQPRDARHEPVDVFEAVTSDDETELSVEAAVRRYQALGRGAGAAELLTCGVELLSLGRDTRDLALEAFRRARGIEGAEAEALYWTAEAHIAAGEAEAATSCLEESLGFAELAVALARLYELQIGAGKEEEAARTMERLTAVAGELPPESD